MKDSKSDYEKLMEKFKFHNDSVQFHAHVAKYIGDEIRENHTEKAKQSGYFTESFFEDKNKADSDEQANASEVEPQTSKARQTPKELEKVE